jgi:hypothetical protein
MDGSSEKGLVLESGIREVHYNVHGQIVTRYRVEMPGNPELTFLDKDRCLVRMDDQPYDDLVAVVEELTGDWHFVGRPTSEYHQSVAGPSVLVVDPADLGDFRAASICVRGERMASVHMSASAGVVRILGMVHHGPPSFDLQVRSDLQPENCSNEEGVGG